MGEDAALLSDGGITARAMQKVIQRLAEDDDVRAVVLRIDSPGGSALASDILWHELMNLRRKKPLVASIGDMAASGGYYLACAATKVVAERTSIVGSIGVVGGKIVVDEALTALGVNAETFAASAAESARSRAAYLSPLEPWDEPTRERVRVQMQAVYDTFIRRVSTGRNLPIEIVQAVAEGRIWSGAQGHKLSLVDELGGLGKALDLARGLAGLDGDAPIRIEGAGETLIESLFSSEAAESSALAGVVRRAAPEARLLDAVAPSLRPFVSALAPLVAGEAAVAALPFALVVK
jgi:protease-4